MRRLNEVLLKLMEGRPADLTRYECDFIARALADWDRMQPKPTGRARKDNSEVALHYWALVNLKDVIPKNAKADVAAAWNISTTRVAEIAKQHQARVRETIEYFRDRPDMLVMLMVIHADRATKK